MTEEDRSLARILGLLACKKPVSVLEAELCEFVGTTPQALRHRALRMILEMKLERCLTKKEQLKLFSHVAKTMRRDRRRQWDWGLSL